MILVEVVLTTTDEQRATLVALMTQAMAGSRDEPGCLSYRFSADLADPLTFHLIELWQDEDAIKAHLQGAPFRDFVAGLRGVGRISSSVARAGELQPYRLPR